MMTTFSPFSAMPVLAEHLVDLADHLVGVGHAVDHERLHAPVERHAAADRAGRA